MKIPLTIAAVVAAGGLLSFALAQPGKAAQVPTVVTSYVDVDGNPIEAPSGADEALRSDPEFVIEYQTPIESDVEAYGDDDQYEDNDSYEDDDQYEDSDSYEDDDD